jgi:predicted O-methyltransferase YrrM
MPALSALENRLPPDSAEPELKAGFPTDWLRRVFADRLAYGASGERVPLHSQVGLDEAEVLYDLVRQRRPADTFEVGLGQGISTLAILHALRDNGSGHHHVADPFQDRFADVGLAMVRRAGLSHLMTFHRAFVEAVAPSLPRLQFVFIDSSHLFDLTLTDFVLADKRLDVGGLMAWHDLWMPSLQKLSRYVLNNRAYRRHPAAGRGAAPAGGLRFSQRVRIAVGGMLRRLPGNERIFREELLHPWPTLCRTNLLVLEKQADDERDWRFHRAF